MKIKQFILALLIFTFIGTANASVISTAWEYDYGQESDVSDADDDTQAYDIGFDFIFYGESFDEVYVSSNGSINFEDNGAFYEVEKAFENYFGRAIAPFNTDLNPEEEGEIYINTLGTEVAGDRRFVVTWLEVIDYEDEFVNTFQAILHESGDIQLNYLELLGSSGDDGEDVIGVTQGDGEHFNYFIVEDGDEDGVFPTGKSLYYSWDEGSSNYTLTTSALNSSVSFTSVPNPATLGIFALSLMALVVKRKKRL